MTIDEAIKILTERPYRGVTILSPEFQEATKLGKEALKGIQAVRQLHPELSPFPLPGETKD